MIPTTLTSLIAPTTPLSATLLPGMNLRRFLQRDFNELGHGASVSKARTLERQLGQSVVAACVAVT
jgi:hypothetical protein